MAVAAVQRKIKAATTTSISIGSGDGWATPNSGNLIVVSANSDATVTISGSGWSAGPSIIDGNGAYTWHKFSNGTESTITASPSVSADIVLSVCEYSGVAAFDAQNSSTIAGTNGTTTSAASVTTSASGDLIVAFALLHSPNVTSAFPTSVNWTNGFTNQLTGDSPATGGSHCTTLVAELLPAGAAGSYSTVASWTNQMADRQHIILAFTASADSGTVAAAGPPRRLRGFPLRRARSFKAAPPQVVLGAPAYPPRPVRLRLKATRLFRDRAWTPVPAQVVVAAPAHPPRLARGRRWPFRFARGRAVTPPVDQVAALLPERIRLRLPRLPRPRVAQLPPPQVTLLAPPFVPPDVRVRVRGLRLLRGRSAGAVPPQVVVQPPAHVPPDVRLRMKWLRLFRGRAAAPLPEQFDPIPAPRLRSRGLPVRRGHAAMPTPPQIVVVPPKQVPLFARIKLRAVGLFRGSSATPIVEACDCQTHRPNTGTTPRPGSGITTRPDIGTTARPCSCGND